MSYSICKICNEKRANKQHIETHGIAYDEYLKKYETEQYSEKRAIAKINELYVTTRHKFSYMDKQGNYHTISTIDNSRRYGLVDSDIKAHLRQQKTLAVFTPKDYSKFIIFDIDTKDLDVLEGVYNALSVYIPNKDIHCSYSGNKGYHVAVFFNQLVESEALEKFYKIILADTGYKPNEVELLGANGRAVKLPLGINFKNKNDSDNYCYFCNQFGVPVGEEISDNLRYLENIRAITPKNIYEAVEVNFGSQNYFTDNELIQVDEFRELKEKAHFVNYSLANKIDTIEKAINLGMNEPNTRHITMLNIAIYLKDIKGYSKEETRAFLQEWITRQDTELYKSNGKEIEQDIKHMTNTVYRRDYRLKTNKRDVNLTAVELKEILAVKEKALRRLYFILYIHGKAYSDETGAFYMTYTQIHEAGNKSRRSHLKQQIKKLEELGKVEIVRQDQYKKPNKYRIPALSNEVVMTVEMDEFNICDLNCDNCLEKACSYLLTLEEIKELFDRRQVRSIYNLKGKCKNPRNGKQSL